MNEMFIFFKIVPLAYKRKTYSTEFYISRITSGITHED